MTDDLSRYDMHPHPTPDRPLLGITVLVVEDSRFASEAIRLLCIRSGARIRRADTLASAHRHLAVYRPSVVIADMGLPDGSGAELIAELAAAQPRVPVLLGMSGDTGADEAALAAGADGFLPKPVESLAVFQQAILSQLPASEGPPGPRALPEGIVHPDPVALADDLVHVAEIMRREDGGTLDYIAQFLGGVARSAHDGPLQAAADSLKTSRAKGRATRMDMARLAGLVEERLAEARAV